MECSANPSFSGQGRRRSLFGQSSFRTFASLNSKHHDSTLASCSTARFSFSTRNFATSSRLLPPPFAPELFLRRRTSPDRLERLCFLLPPVFCRLRHSKTRRDNTPSTRSSPRFSVSHSSCCQDETVADGYAPVYLHKPAFAQALLHHPDEPLASPWAASVVTVCLEAGVYILAVARNWIKLDPVLCSRWWCAAFSLQAQRWLNACIAGTSSSTPSPPPSPSPQIGRAHV